MFERTKVCSPQGLWSYTDLERVLVERNDSKTRAIYADAIAESAISQDFSGTGDGDSCAPIFRLSLEFGDNCKC